MKSTATNGPVNTATRLPIPGLEGWTISLPSNSEVAYELCYIVQKNGHQTSLSSEIFVRTTILEAGSAKPTRFMSQSAGLKTRPARKHHRKLAQNFSRG